MTSIGQTYLNFLATANTIQEHISIRSIEKANAEYKTYSDDKYDFFEGFRIEVKKGETVFICIVSIENTIKDSSTIVELYKTEILMTDEEWNECLITGNF